MAEMTLKIIACRQVYQGVNKRGDSFTIFEVDAERDGRRVNEKLRSFTALPIGKSVDVTVTRFESQKHGHSFTLQPKGGRSSSTTDQLNEVREQVAELFSRMATLSDRIAALEQTRSPAVQPDEPAPQEVANGANFGDEPPW